MAYELEHENRLEMDGCNYTCNWNHGCSSHDFDFDLI